MINDRVHVGPAEISEVGQIVKVHQDSFPGFFLTFLGTRFMTLLYEDLCNCPSAVLLVARRGGRVVGFAGGVENESSYFASLKQRRAREFARASMIAVARQPTILPRLWRARRRDVEGSSVGPPATLLTIGVSPEGQGLGVGAALLNSFTQALRDRGIPVFTLTTDAVDNERAIRFYEAAGMRRVRTFKTPEGRVMFEFESLPAW